MATLPATSLETSAALDAVEPPAIVISPVTDYLAVATEWHRRGFFTTPVKPGGTKHPRLNEWNTKPAKNLSVAMQHAYDYPHDDVGLVSTRGEGHYFWLDIDHESVEDRVFNGTDGKILPRTLTTYSRPKTAPWKKHLCFRQTAYSVSQWQTEMNGIRDFTMPKGSDGKIPNLFDCKGVGGGGFVVAAGCWRHLEYPKDSGNFIDDQYTLDDASIIDVPDWLVDWVLKEYKRFRREDAIRCAAEAELNRINKAALTKAETDEAVRQFEYDPTEGVLSINAKGGALVPEAYRHGWLKSFGGRLATRGIPKTLIEQMLQIATGVCEPYDSDDERDKAVQKIVNRLRIGNLWIGRAQIRDAEYADKDADIDPDKNPHKDISSLVSSLVNPPTRLSVLRTAGKGLPWNFGEIPGHFLNSQLRAACTSANIDCGTSVDWKKAVSTAMKGIGAKARKFRSPSGRIVWAWSMEKQQQDQEQPQQQEQEQEQEQAYT